MDSYPVDDANDPVYVDSAVDEDKFNPNHKPSTDLA